MKRLGTLVMAILLITGCNAMQPNMEETELLWQETEKNIQKWTISTKAEAIPAKKPRIIPELTVEIPQKTPELTEKPVPQTPTPTPSPEPAASEPEITVQPEPPTSPQTERPDETPVMIDWPYPPITCPPEPEPTPEPDWPYITAPEPTLQPAEPPTTSTPEPPAEQPSTGYAVCSCGARLTPEELVPHMKAHALYGENHSYWAY